MGPVGLIEEQNVENTRGEDDAVEEQTAREEPRDKETVDGQRLHEKSKNKALGVDYASESLSEGLVE